MEEDSNKEIPVQDDTVDVPKPEQDASNEPTESDIVAAAEAEAPVETKSPFEPEPEPTETPEEAPKEKSKKPLFATLAVLLVAIIGVSVWYLLRPKAEESAEIKHDVEPIPALEPVEASKLAMKGNDLSDFDLAFLRLENKTENIIYSPLSIKYALAMLSDGANGRSREQITAVIGDYQQKAYLNSANRSLANAMFIRTAFEPQVKATFRDTLTSKYNAEVIIDPFTSPDNANKWVEDKTLGIIKNTFTEGDINIQTDYVLVNALAIDMQWNNRIQCAASETWQTDTVQNIDYSVRYAHENYYDYVGCLMGGYDRANFNGKENTEVGKIGTSVNRYDIISELGEAHIRETARAEYIKYLNESIANWQETLSGSDATEWQKEELPKSIASAEESLANPDTYLDEYISDLSANFGKLNNSTDFYFLDGDSEKVFAKDLQEYDGSVLQYVGIMPKSGSLNSYLNNLTAEKTSSLISSLKDASNINNYKNGVVTKIKGYVPFFKFDFTMEGFMNNLERLGITDVFSGSDADLSNMIEFDENLSTKPHINIAIHKADIDFSNDGIKAGAVTAFGGKGGGGDEFDYEWDVPVEEIDLTFDKPFLFLIRDKNTGEIWFTGTVYEGNVQE